jgi:hypothetical protein
MNFFKRITKTLGGQLKRHASKELEKVIVDSVRSALSAVGINPSSYLEEIAAKIVNDKNFCKAVKEKPEEALSSYSGLSHLEIVAINRAAINLLNLPEVLLKLKGSHRIRP